jgi:hypothetical protein
MSELKGEEAIFDAAIDLPSGERGVFLDEACGPDSVLRRSVEALLRAWEQGDGFLAHPAVPELTNLVSGAGPLTEKPGDRIGGYKLLQQIGEGGCGVVYMAEQETPVRRRVALKVIKLGMDTKRVVARFAADAGLFNSCASPADSLPRPASRSRCCSNRVASRIRSDISPTSRVASSGILCTSSGNCDAGNRRTRASLSARPLSM